MTARMIGTGVIRTLLLAAAAVLILMAGEPGASASPGTIDRVSVASDGTEGNGNSGTLADVSAEGRYVAFSSDATNLVAGDTNATTDVFVRDRDADDDGVFDEPGSVTTVRVSVDSVGNQANAASVIQSLSLDGRLVAFRSSASNLVPNDTNGRLDIFVHDLDTAVTTRVSVDSAGAEANSFNDWPALSGDGRWVAFMSGASNLVLSDTNAAPDIFVHDRQTGSTSRVSISSAGTEANGQSQFTEMSADGRFVAFSSWASNLVPGDTNATSDAFVHDRDTDEDGIFDEVGAVATTRVSVDSSGNQASSDGQSVSISADGRYVGFCSSATNLVGGDTNATIDAFIHDRFTGKTERVGVDSAGSEGDDMGCDLPIARIGISSGGRYVTFASLATNLVAGDTNATFDVFVRDRQVGTTVRVSVDGVGSQANDTSWFPAISGDGRHVVFESSASNLVANDTNGLVDTFVAVNPLALCPGATQLWPVPAGDDDCDGFTTTDETAIGTDSIASCALTGAANDEADDKWPPDFDDNQVINTTDVFQVLPPFFGTAVPPTSVRRDLFPDGVINTTDVFRVLPPFLGSSCIP